MQPAGGCKALERLLLLVVAPPARGVLRSMADEGQGRAAEPSAQPAPSPAAAGADPQAGALAPAPAMAQQQVPVPTTSSAAVCEVSRPGAELCEELRAAACPVLVAAPGDEPAPAAASPRRASDLDAQESSPPPCAPFSARHEPFAPSVPPVQQDCGADEATRAPEGSTAVLTIAEPHSTAAHAADDDKVGDTPGRGSLASATAADQDSTSILQVQLIPTPSSSSSGYACEYCGTVAKERYGSGRFCSRPCGARFSRNVGQKRAASPEDRQSEHVSSTRKSARVVVHRAPHARSRKSMDADTVKRCEAVLDALMGKEDAKPFCVRVDPDEYPGYTSFVSEPMDLSIVTANLQSGKYRTVSEFSRHTRLVFENCLAFNHARSPICKVAHRLLAMFERLLEGWVMTAEPLAPDMLDDGLCMVCATEDQKDHASMLLCDGCDAAYHMNCLVPPMSTVPLVDWFCPQCADNQTPPDVESARPVRTLRSSVCDRTEVERKALDRWLRSHIGEPVMLENGSVGILQGFRFGYCQIDTGGVQPTTKSPHEVSLNQADLVIDYEVNATESRTTAPFNDGEKNTAQEPVAASRTKPLFPTDASESSSSSPPSSPTLASPNRSTRRTAATANISTQATFGPSDDRANKSCEDSSERPKNAWVCVNCLKQNSWNARKCSSCSELKGHTASEIATLNRSGHRESQQDRDVPAFLLARFATAVGFDRRMMSHKGTHDHAFCATSSRSGASPSSQLGASRRIKSARINKCGHPERRHHAKGFCLKCYRTDLAKRKEAVQCTALTASKPAGIDASLDAAAAAESRAKPEHQQTKSAALVLGLKSPHAQRAAAPAAAPDEKIATGHGTTSDANHASKQEPPSESVESAVRSASGDATRAPSLEPLHIKSETMNADHSASLEYHTGNVGDVVQTLSGEESQPCDSTTTDTAQEVDVNATGVARRSPQKALGSDALDATSVADQTFAAADGVEVLPERPERLLCMYNHLKANAVLEGTVAVSGREATLEELLSVHTADYIQMVLDLENDKAAKDTPLAAKLAVGTTTDTVSAVVVGYHDTDLQREQVQNGMAIVRPPGHHAGPNTAQGWCYFNNVAIAARAAQKNHGVRRVLIIDWDVHHGNGTEEIFYKDASVLTVSLHRKVKDFYPESGAPDEVGEDQGLGFNCNIAWSRDGMGDAEYMMAFSRVVLPLAYEFNPDLVLVSAGFDAGVGDPLGGCCVTPAGFAQLTSMLMGLAGSKLVLVCEGGYNLRTISRASAACLRVLRGEMPAPIARKLKPKQSAVSDLLRTEIALSSHWSSFYQIDTFSPYALSRGGTGSAASAGSLPANSTSGFADNVPPHPQGTQLLSKEGLRNAIQTGELLHSKVSVWWRGDKRWYPGSIQDVDCTANTFVVLYDDSEVTTETINALVALHATGATDTRIESPRLAAAAAAAAASTSTEVGCDEPCPCPGATKRERIKAWVQKNLGKTVHFRDGRKGTLLGPGRGYMQLQLHGDTFPSHARTRDLLVPRWVLADRYESKHPGHAARGDTSNEQRHRHIGGRQTMDHDKRARRKTNAEQPENSGSSDGNDTSDSSDESDDTEEEHSDEQGQLNQYRYTKWLQKSVGRQIKLKDGRRGTMVGSRTGFIEVVLRREGVVRVRRGDITLPRSLYHRAESIDDEGSSGTESDEDEADSSGRTEESSDEDGDGSERGETINSYRYRQWIQRMIGREITFKDGRRGMLVNSGAGFLRVRVKGIKQLVSVRNRELDLPHFLFERDLLRRPCVDAVLAATTKDAPAAVRNQPPKRRNSGGNDEKSSKVPRN